MKICAACKKRYDGPRWQCSDCGHAVAFEHGFPLFAAGAAATAVGFKPGYFAQLAEYEEKNFWFVARNRLIVWLVQKYFPNARSFLEIGCGTGFVLSGIAAASPKLSLSGSELFPQGLVFAASRVPTASLFQMDACSIPFADEFDVIGAFDVLEHIEEDELVLRQIHQALAPGGGLLLTVPQHRFLWSRQDETACHVRRYEARELRRKVEQAGFAVERMASFVSLLLPLMALSRRRKRGGGTRKFDPMDELRMGGFANAALKMLLQFEVSLTRIGVSFPAGGSLALVARKIVQ